MGKKRIIKKGESSVLEATSASSRKKTKKRITKGNVYVTSTYNNTICTITDEIGAVAFWASAGSLGFSGAKKGTPYAASKVAGSLVERARAAGMEEISLFVRGIGAGRESAIRAFAAGGFIIHFVKDITAVPFNGPKPPKARRV